jgi:hypothetical protein
MTLESYQKFIKNPCTSTFHALLQNIHEFSALQPFQKFNKKVIHSISSCLLKKHLNSSNQFIYKKNRKGPVLSATCFPEKFQLPTIDHKVWIVRKNAWRMMEDFDYKQIMNDVFIMSFQLNKSILKNFRINILSNHFVLTNNLMIGESLLHKEKINPGIYKIMELAGSLLLTPTKLTNEQLFREKWKKVNYTIAVDGGTFGFHNGEIIEKMIQSKYIESPGSEPKKMFTIPIKKGSKNPEIHLPFEYQDLTIQEKKKKIFGKDFVHFTPVNDYIRKNKLENELISIYESNQYGDGSFDVYKSNNGCMLIMSPKLYMTIQYIDEYFYKIR